MEQNSETNSYIYGNKQNIKEKKLNKTDNIVYNIYDHTDTYTHKKTP